MAPDGQILLSLMKMQIEVWLQIFKYAEIIFKETVAVETPGDMFCVLTA